MKFIKVAFSAIILFFLTFSNSFNVSAQINNEVNIDIETIPDNYLFNLANLKPGDSAGRKLTVLNIGEQNFTYNTKAEFKGGSKELYHEFLLEVWDENETLFKGKLKDFKELSPRFLKSMNEENLFFELEFPYELGNEFQGLAFDVEFIFYVEGHTGSPGNSDGESTNQPISKDELASPPKDGQILPSTSTHSYNTLFVGTILILGGVGGVFLLKRIKKSNAKN